MHGLLQTKPPVVVKPILKPMPLPGKTVVMTTTKPTHEPTTTTFKPSVKTIVTTTTKPIKHVQPTHQTTTTFKPSVKTVTPVKLTTTKPTPQVEINKLYYFVTNHKIIALSAYMEIKFRFLSIR